jgi:hypothetical protein
VGVSLCFCCNSFLQPASYIIITISRADEWLNLEARDSNDLLDIPKKLFSDDIYIYIISCTKIADEWQIYCGVIPDITVLFSLIIAGAFSIRYKAFFFFLSFLNCFMYFISVDIKLVHAPTG